MEWQRDEIPQPERHSEPSGRRRSYASPEIQEWGSILDLTQGGITLGKNDFPKKGGSQPT